MSIDKNKWLDISVEKSRTYEWVDSGRTIHIKNPKRLMVSTDGGHRVDNGGPICYYIKPTWDVLVWDGKFLF